MSDDRSDSKILILFAHPALEKSRVNARLADAVRHLPGVRFRDLYELYPEFDVDVPREQALLEAHDTIVLQHPFYWYSVPPLLKQWIDLVLEHGWAYGAKGRALVGKRFVTALTAGGRESSYQPGGLNHYTIREFLAPIERTFGLCRSDCLPPFVVYGTHGMEEREILRHAADYRRVIEGLRDGRIDVTRAVRHERLNARLDEILRAPEGGD